MMLTRVFNPIDPWKEIADLRREMNRLFDGFWTDRTEIFPAINIRSNEEEAVVTVALPGVDQKDLRLTVLGDVLTLEGARKAEPLKEKETWHRLERFHGEFKRRLELPFSVDVDRIQATLKNGILTIHLPRKEEDKPKTIQIQS